MNEPPPAGFLSALFDLSFKELITPRIIKILFILGIIGSGLSAATLAIMGLAQGGVGYLSLVVAPILFLIWVISLRVWLELVMVMFKISDNVDLLAKKEPPR
jgi:hypothetical protein